MKLQKNSPGISEAVLLEACFLTNGITAFKKNQFPESEWPKGLLGSFNKLKAGWYLYHASHWDFDNDLQYEPKNGDFLN